MLGLWGLVWGGGERGNLLKVQGLGDLLGDGALLFSSGRRLNVLSGECPLSVVATQGIAGVDGGWESLTVAFYHPLLL